MAKQPSPTDVLELNRSTRRTADADAKRLDAAARASEAAARSRKADAEANAIESANRQREAEQRARLDREAELRSPANQARQLALNVGGAGVGLVLAHRMSKSIDIETAITAAVRNAGLKAAAGQANVVLKGDAKVSAGGKSALAQLRGAVETADKLKLTRIVTPLALAKVAVLVSEAAIARLYFEPKAGSDTERDLWKGLGNAATFAAGGLLAERLIRRSAPAAIPDGKSMAVIEKARALIKAGPITAPVVAQHTKRSVVKLSPVATPRPAIAVLQAAVASSAARNTSIGGQILATATKASGRVAALALLATGAITIASRLTGSGSAEASERTPTWTDKNGKVYTRTPAGLAAITERGNR